MPSGDEGVDSLPLADLREDTLNVKVLSSGKKVVLVRRGDEVHAYGEVCPHMGADLAEGTYCAKTNTIQCKWHGYIFGADDGRFVENPNERFMRLIRVASEHYRPDKTPRYRLPVVPCTVRDGTVVVGRAREAEAGRGDQRGVES